MAKHHKYGGSTSSRWLNCPGSTALIDRLIEAGKIPKKDDASIYAENGTIAHALGEICLNHGYNVHDFYGKTIPSFIGKKLTNKYLDQNEFTHIDISKEIIDEDYIHAVKVYIDYIKDNSDEDSIVSIEERSELTDYVGADCGGSSDAAIIKLNDLVLHVNDYKHGSGVVVEIFGNTQLRLYALGLYRKYRKEFLFKEIQITIIQPRASHTDGPIRSEIFSVKDLIKWGRKTLKPAIKLSEEQYDNEKLKLIAGEKQCQWCRAAGHCKECANHSLAIAQQDFKSVAIKTNELPAPETLTKEETKLVLDNAPLIINWVKKVQAHAENALESGERIKGYKIVERISNRKYGRKEKRLIRALKKRNIINIYEPRKIKSPAQLEKFLAIETDWTKAEITKFVNRFTIREVTGTSIANANDGRNEVKPSIETDFADEVAKKPKTRKTRKRRRNRK